MRANGGKSDCGVLSYAMADAQYADKVVAITDCLVPSPNLPASISQVNVDYVVVVDEIRKSGQDRNRRCKAHHRRAQDPDGGLLHGIRDQHSVL